MTSVVHAAADPANFSTLTYIVLALGALLCSMVSGVTGVGGGMVYLPILTWGVGIKTAVPYLSLLLLVANFSRAYFSRMKIDWTVWKHFVIGAIPGAAIGALIYTTLSVHWVARCLGIYLVSYVILNFTKSTWPKTATLRSISIMGVPAGLVSAVVGGSGPVVVPWLLRYGLVKEAFLGTEAMGAGAIHVVKLAVWGGAGMFGIYDLLLLLPLALLMIVGSYLGTSLVGKMDVRVFRVVLIFTLAAVGIRFLFY